MCLRLFVFLSVLSPAAIALAQDADTRAGQADRARREKAGMLRPYQPSKIEAALFRIEDRLLVERFFNPPRGAFVRVGGMPEGQGFTLGPGYRFSSYDMSFTTTGVASIRGAWEVNTRLDFPRPAPLAVPRRSLSIGAMAHRLPQEDFYGSGTGSERSARSAYRLDERTLDMTAGVSPAPWLAATGTAAYHMERPGRSNDPRHPAATDAFAPNAVPGLQSDLDFVSVGGRMTLNLTRAPDATLVGGRYTAGISRFFDRSEDRYSFTRWDVDLQQFVPIVTSARLLALRARAQGVSPAGGQDVPVYWQPALGGSHSLRGYSYQRFQDRNALLLQAEYRFELNAFMTGSLFYDAGAVAFKARNLDLTRLRDDWGFGLRFGFAGLTGMRAEVVFGGDGGTVYTVRFGDVF